MDVVANSNLSLSLLSEDVVGGLLPLLSSTDIKNFRLACGVFATAVQHQIRCLQLLYLPKHPTGSWLSLERLQLSINRCRTVTDSSDGATPSGFTSLAPVRSLSGIPGLRHAACVDLSGQHLPANAMLLLCPLTRLKSLCLKSCQLPVTSFASISSLDTLTSLDISGIQLTGSLQARDTAPDPAGTSDRQSRQATGQLLDAICQLKQLQELRLDMAAKPKVLPEMLHQPLVESVNGIAVKRHVSKLTALKRLQALSLRKQTLGVDDFEVLFSVIGPQLKELHFLWGYAQSSQIGHSYEPIFDHGVFLQVGNLTNLQALRLDVGVCLEPLMPPTIAPVAASLTSLTLSGGVTWQLVLSIGECRKLRKLQLLDVPTTAVLWLGELLQHVVSCLPDLESLEMKNVLERSGPQQVHRQLQPIGDNLLLQLASCCPKLTQLLLPDLAMIGTGLRLVAIHPQNHMYSLLHNDAHLSNDDATSSHLVASDSDHNAWSSGSAASVQGGLRACQHLQLYVFQMMRSAFPHLSALTGLRSLTLFGMMQQEFAQLCKLKCLEGLSNLTNLTSLRILPVVDELVDQERRLQQQHRDPDRHATQASAKAVLEVASGWAAGLDEDGTGTMHVDNAVEMDVADQQQEDIGPEEEQDQQQQQQEQPQPLQQHQQQEQQAEDDADDAMDDAPIPPQAAFQQVQHLIVEHMLHIVDNLQQQAAALAAHPQQQQQAGNAFAQHVDMMLMAHHQLIANQAPGAAEVEAAVENIEAVAAQLAEGAAPVPPGVDPEDLLEAALDAIQQQQQVQQQQQQPEVPYPGIIGLRQHQIEPHLHFLDTMTGLVNLELNCLHTAGPCLLHLNNLSNLRSLSLGGSINLSAKSWDIFAQLRLPGVTCLSFTGCNFTVAASDSRAGSGSNSGCTDEPCNTAAAEAGPSSSSSASRTRRISEDSIRAQQMDAIMCKFIHALCGSFPNAAALELGSCRFLTAARLIELVQKLPKLAKLRLLGLVGLQLHCGLPLPPLDIHKWIDTCTVAAAVDSSSTAADNSSKSEQRMAAVSKIHDLLTMWYGKWYSLPHRTLQGTCAAIQHLNSLAESGVAAVDINYIELCQSEIPQGVLTAVHGLSKQTSELGKIQQLASVAFVKHEGSLKGYVRE